MALIYDAWTAAQEDRGLIPPPSEASMGDSPYYWTCPYCDANLDPGETCDCRK